MALIELRDVWRRHVGTDAEVLALQGVSLSIARGEYVAVVGQSGSGKSTLLNLLGALDRPSSGQVLLGGRDLATLTPDELADVRRRDVGFIFQQHHLLPQLDALRNAALPAVYLGAPSSLRRLRAAGLLGYLGLADRVGHLPAQLSGGQQQRVAIARALMNDARILLADEPTGALDSASGEEVLKQLDALHASGHTILLVTHDARVASRAQRVIEVCDGRVASDVRRTPTPLVQAGNSQALVSPVSQASPRTLPNPIWRLSYALGPWHEAASAAMSAMRARPLRTVLSMLGVAVGVASLVAIRSLSAATSQAVTQEAQSLLSGRLQVWRGQPSLHGGGEMPRAFSMEDLAAVEALAGVKSVAAERSSLVTGRYAAQSAKLLLVSTAPATLDIRRAEVVRGRDISPLDRRSRAQVLLIDDRAATALFGANVDPLGRSVLLGMPGAQDTVATPMTVVGVLGYTLGSPATETPFGAVMAPSETYSSRLDPEGEVDTFNVQLDYTVPPSTVRDSVVRSLTAQHGRQDFEVSDGSGGYEATRNIAADMGALHAGMAVLALLLGGTGVMNVMLVAVTERVREIGIRLAVGARPRDILRQFMLEAVMLCGCGGAAGAVLGVLFTWAVNNGQARLSLAPSLEAVVLGLAVSCSVGLICGVVPARRAAALDPAIALARQ